METSTDNLRFTLLPANSPPSEALYLHNNAYRMWRDVWQDTFDKLGIPHDKLEGEFGRQGLVACISEGDKPLAVHLYSFYSIDSIAAREHPYMTGNYPEIFFAKLAHEGVRTVMSMEYMTVHPNYRKSSGQVHVGEALGGLAQQTMKWSGADASIAPARRDRKIHLMAYGYGGEPVIENVKNHNVDCDLVMIRRERIKPHRTPETQALIERLWESRRYHPTCEPVSPSKVLPFKRAA